MSEALANKAAFHFNGRGAQNRFCDAAVRLVAKHFAASGRGGADVAGRVRSLAIIVGTCPAVNVSSIFAPSVLAPMPRAARIVDDTLNGGFIDYLAALTESIGDTPTANDAYAVSAAYVAAADGDGALLAGDVAVVAGAAAISDASTTQWQYAESMFWWGWLQRVVGVVKADVGGCAAGAAAGFLGAMSNHWEHYGIDDAINTCSIGASAASLTAWGSSGGGGSGGTGGGDDDGRIS
jgi:hypothetical protein